MGGFKLLVLFLGAERSHWLLLGTGFAEFAKRFIDEFAFAVGDLDCLDGFTAFVVCHIHYLSFLVWFEVVYFASGMRSLTFTMNSLP